MKNLFYLLLCLIAGTSCSQADPTKPWDKGAFETQKYRNLLAEMGYKQADIDAKLKSVFDGVFYGPDKVYFEVGDSMAYISDIKNHDVRTEGMSYGLLQSSSTVKISSTAFGDGAQSTCSIKTVR